MRKASKRSTDYRAKYEGFVEERADQGLACKRRLLIDDFGNRYSEDVPEEDQLKHLVEDHLCAVQYFDQLTDSLSDEATTQRHQIMNLIAELDTLKVSCEQEGATQAVNLENRIQEVKDQLLCQQTNPDPSQLSALYQDVRTIQGQCVDR